MAELISLVDPGRVRRAIEPTWSQSDLPDDAVTDPMFTAPAVAELLLLDPAADTREEPELSAVATALNLLVAAQLVTVVRFVTKEDFGEAGGETYQQVDAEQRAADYRRRAAQVAAFTAPAPPAGVPPAFIVVS